VRRRCPASGGALLCGLMASIGGLAGAASSQAGLVTAAEGAIHMACAESGSAVPLGRLELRHAISAEGFVGSGLLMVFDSSDEDVERPGLLRGTVGRLGANGRSQRVGVLGASTDVATGEAEAASPLRGPVASGDTVSWEVRLRRFRDLPPDECVSLLVAVTGSDAVRSAGEEE
jgi:hypothetical protein